ncbi:MAG: cytochrome c [Acidobacteria bacterium]|nr:cytochrome c [Acidobacteriota bacterium]
MIERYVDQEELRRLLSTLVVILGCLIIGGLFASIVVPGLRNANRPATPTAIAPVVGESGWLDPTEYQPSRMRVIPPVDPKTLIEPSAGLTSLGKDLYEANCVTCHGLRGEGNGPAAAAMAQKPRDLTKPDGWKNGYEMPAVFRTITEGIAGTSMSAFDFLSRRDRMALVHYVQSLAAFSHKGDGPGMEALSKELASTGEVVPNKIPVSMAMNRLEKEFAPSPPVSLEDSDSPGCEVLQRVVTDPARAAQFLAQSRLWRVSYRDLAAAVVRDMPANGFSPSSATLSIPEWRLLHSELLQRVKTK